LSNSNETIALKNSSLSVIDNVTYFSTWGAAGNNNSLQFFNGTWCESFPTPGSENNCVQQSQNPPESPDNQTSNQTNFNLKLKIYIENATAGTLQKNLFKIETNKDNCSVKDNVAIDYNISNSNYLYQNSSLKEIGCSGYADTGYWQAIEGNFTICGNAHIEREEKNYSDNAICGLIQVQPSENGTNETAENEEGNESQSHHDYEYFAENIPEIITDSNLNFTITIRIKNNKNESKAFDIWSYIYRANKCYSQDREANKRQITVNPGQENRTELYNELNISEVKENGEYKFKIKILRTEIKTPVELTYNMTINITIRQKAESNKIKNKTDSSEKEEFLNNQNLAQYESKSEKIKKTAAYIFAATCFIFISYLFFKNRNHGKIHEH
jgi:hypothetical protein